MIVCRALLKLGRRKRGSRRGLLLYNLLVEGVIGLQTRYQLYL